MEVDDSTIVVEDVLESATVELVVLDSVLDVTDEEVVEETESVSDMVEVVVSDEVSTVLDAASDEVTGAVVGVADVVGAIEATAEVVAREFEEERERSAIVSGVQEKKKEWKMERGMKRESDKDSDVVYVVLQCTIRRCLLWLLSFRQAFLSSFAELTALAGVLKLARFGYRSGEFHMVYVIYQATTTTCPDLDIPKHAT